MLFSLEKSYKSLSYLTVDTMNANIWLFRNHPVLQLDCLFLFPSAISSSSFESFFRSDDSPNYVQLEFSLLLTGLTIVIIKIKFGDGIFIFSNTSFFKYNLLKRHVMMNCELSLPVALETCKLLCKVFTLPYEMSSMQNWIPFLKNNKLNTVQLTIN